MSGATGRSEAARDLALVVGVLLVAKAALLRFDALWSYAGPLSLLTALAVAHLRLRRSREAWSDLGLIHDGSRKRLALQTLAALVTTIVAGATAQSLAVSVLGAPDAATQAIDARYQGRFDAVPGDPAAFVFWLAIAWIIGGFTEEMLFRGFLFARSERLLRGAPLAAGWAILPQAILFGHQHLYYQGAAGWVANGVMATVSGLIYLGFGRRLWPLVLSHGLSNTLGLTVLFLSRPG